jgi:alkaline phosphatase D
MLRRRSLSAGTLNSVVMPSPSRRQLLQLAGACASPLWLPGSAVGRPRWTQTPFQLGVASGSPTHDGVVLWTRLMGAGGQAALDTGNQPVTVSWELAQDDAFTRIVQRGEARAVTALAHSVHVEVRGLAPDRWYFYRFTSGEAMSPVGRTRTFPAPGASTARLRMAYASCQKWEDGYFSAYRHMLAENLDLVMFLGDYIYEYPGRSSRIRVPNATSNNGWVITLDDYRSRYAKYKTEPELQAMHAACPWLMTWDDHEVQNDYAGAAPGSSGRPVADFLLRRTSAYQAYYEHMPLRAAVLTRALAGLETGAELRLYGQLRFGDLASLYLLDNRQYRDPQACTPDGKPGSGALDPESCARWNDPQRSLLGKAQEAWLEQALTQAGDPAAGRAVWNVIGQQSLFGQRDFRPGPDRFFWNDGWDGYAPARSRLCRALGGSQAPNPVLLGGDVHENWVGHVKADYGNPSSASLGVEFCGTSVTSRSGNSAKTSEWLAENPHFVFANTEKKGYGVVEFTPERLITRLRVMDQVSDREGRMETLASFEVQAGRPVLEKI